MLQKAHERRKTSAILLSSALADTGTLVSAHYHHGRSVLVSPVKRIEFSYPRSDLQNTDSAVARIPGDNIVWWYGSIRRNPMAKTMPLVEVQFKRLYDDVPGPGTPVLLPLANLPHYRIGTIWRGGKCISDIEMECKDHLVNFSGEGWTITSRDELYKSGMGKIFSDNDYPLKYPRDKSLLLNFKLPEGKNLLVPCIDFFVRGYARNMDVCRAICSLLFPNIMSVFYECTMPDEHEWIVKPSRKVRKYDSVFLAHLLYDDLTLKRVGSINAQFLSKKPGEAVFPRVKPWFSGPAELRCRGKWINEGHTFLCLDLAGGSKPPGKTIHWITPELDNSNGKESGRLVMPTPVRTAEADEFLAEESYAEPDAHSEITIVRTPPFADLGPEREVKTVKHVTLTDRGRLAPRPPKPESHASGTGFGGGKYIGKSEHVADKQNDAEIETQGFLNDIWNAFQSIKSANPDRVTDVSWYVPSRFRNSAPPRIILFNTEGVNPDQTDVLRLVYLNAEFTQRRGMMVLRVIVDSKAFLCFEIQRAEPDEKNKKPKGFSGVLMPYTIAGEGETEHFVNKVCIATRLAEGYFKHVRGIFPDSTMIFRHRPHGKALVHRRRLVNAFKQMGVDLS